jgi:hypothetical protein
MTQSTPQQRALIGAGNAAKIAEEMKRSQQDSLMKQIFSAVQNDDESFTHSRLDLHCSKCICSGCRAQGRQ